MTLTADIDVLQVAEQAMQIEADSIRAAAGRLDGNISEAVRLIVAHSGKVVLCGVGKSGHIARKITATLCSTGTPAVFLHAGDAAHGDMGVYSPQDPTILISKSGNTAELLRLIPMLRGFKSPLIGIVGNSESPLAREVDVLLDASVAREADPHGLAPTASTAVALALGDALAIALMQARHFTPEDFGRYHPGGQLGRNLRLKARDVMHSGERVAWVRPDDPIKEIVCAMTQRNLGACVVIAEGQLAGLITDGDLRRAIQAHDDIWRLKAQDMMTPHPVSILPDSTLHDALRLMEDRPSQISVLPVVDGSGACLGLLRLHDVYTGK